ncbi:MAG: FHA domain-containing protein [Thermoanaerobaculia bacterium]
MRLSFGDCILDLTTRQLVSDSGPAATTPKAFELLEVLVLNRPRALSKTELHDRLWPDTFVSETSLARLVSEVRKAIGDAAREPRYIRTVHGYGYSFCGEAVELRGFEGPAGAQTCRLLWGRRAVSLRPGANLLGRGADAVLRVDSPKVSRRHTRIVVEGEQATLEDLGSKNGTYVEGKRVVEPVTLADGDQISIGSVVLVFRVGSAETTETELSHLHGEGRP